MSETKLPEQYEGTIIPVGNSQGMRLPSGFFKAHPEFNGKVQLTVVADGEVLMSAKAPARRKPKETEADPVVTSFLRFLEKQMTDNPQHIVEADATQLRRIGKLVKGVKID